MRYNRYLISILAALMLMGCGVKKRMPKAEVPLQPSQEVVWHTCLIQGARGTIRMGDEELSANVTMQVVRDSMLVISVMPVLGMEMIRLEATPDELTGINKLDGTYAVTTYESINRNLVPTVSWEILQQLCSAELPIGNDKARIVYTLGDKTVELTINYPERIIDAPVRVNHLRTDRYKKIDISRWL